MSFRVTFTVTIVLMLFLNSHSIAHAGDTPLMVDGQLIYPEGAQIPRSLTPVEVEYMASHPVAAPRAVTSPPDGPVHCVAEYEPMDGILIAWENATGGIDTILKTMALQITTNAASNGARVYCVVDNASEQSSVSSLLSSFGVNMSKVTFVIRTTDTIWIRDYGPRYIYLGQCRAVVDHTYNRPRPNDDAFSSYFATFKKHAFFEHQLVHGGGNYHLDANDHSFATELIWNENTGLSHTFIHDTWQSFQNVDTHIFPPFPTSIDSTQHLDMWMEVIADDKVIISDWPNNVGSTQDIICDNAATYMAGQGYTVFRVPARSVSGVHYTYTNVVMCNDLVLIPSYTNATVSPHNAQALATWQAALPGKTIVQVNCQAIVSLAGVMHCIVMHVPQHLGGANPTAYLRTLRGPETLIPGQMAEIRWISDDDEGTANADILLSTNGGASYDTVIASATADDGSFLWTVPSIYTTKARIRVVIRDAINKTGQDQSDVDLVIDGAAMPGDMNCDVTLDISDVEPFTTALLDAGAFTECNLDAADMNLDTLIDGADIEAFTNSLLSAP